jgi:hypothetical protein
MSIPGIALFCPSRSSGGFESGSQNSSPTCYGTNLGGCMHPLAALWIRSRWETLSVSHSAAEGVDQTPAPQAQRAEVNRDVLWVCQFVRSPRSE